MVNYPTPPSYPSEGVDELFYNDRLEHADSKDYPIRIDQAAINLKYGILIGESSQQTRHGSGPPGGGTITSFDFGRATGQYYKRGLKAITTDRSELRTDLSQYDDREISDLAFRLNEVRYDLQQQASRVGNETDIDDLDEVIESIVEKVRTRSMRAADAAVLGQSLRDPESVTDIIQRILRIRPYRRILTSS